MTYRPPADAPPDPTPSAWDLVKTHPDVVSAQAALDAWEAEEDGLIRTLGRALRHASTQAEEHLAACDPWIEPCSWCGRRPAAAPIP